MITLRDIINDNKTFVMSILSDKYKLVVDKLLETPPIHHIGCQIANLGPLGITVVVNNNPYCNIQDLEQIFDMPIDIENWQEDPLPAKFEKNSTCDITILRMILEQLNVIRIGTLWYKYLEKIYSNNTNKNLFEGSTSIYDPKMGQTEVTLVDACHNSKLISKKLYFQKSDLDIFEANVRDYYEVKEHNCLHENNNLVLWLQDIEEHGIYSFETDGWHKDICCEKCCKNIIDSAACSGEYANYRLFKNGVDISNAYRLRINTLKTNVLKFCYHPELEYGGLMHDMWYTFVLRKKDFKSFYEAFFYKQIKKWHKGNGTYTDNIGYKYLEKTINNMLDKKDKFWNVQYGEQNSKTLEGYFELKTLDYFDLTPLK